MSRSVSEKATKEGVVRLPWSFAMILDKSQHGGRMGVIFSQTSILSSLKIPTQEYVVPKSMPIAGAMVESCECGIKVDQWFGMV